jgi:putative ATP-binding cassette transporter
VTALRDALTADDSPSGEPGGITLREHALGHLRFDHLSVALGGARATLDPGRVEVSPGERILIVPERSSDKSPLFRAMAGLWPWGSGTIYLPPRRSTMFMPQRPYLPLGSLHAAVSYPTEPERFESAEVSAALERVGLEYLVPSLEREQRWDRDLSLDEQQRLAFARLVLHQPSWVLLDDAMGALEEDHRQLVLSLFDNELADAAVISIGRTPAHHGFYSRVLHFRRLSEGALSFRPRSRPATPVPAFATIERVRARG